MNSSNKITSMDKNVNKNFFREIGELGPQEHEPPVHMKEVTVNVDTGLNLNILNEHLGEVRVTNRGVEVRDTHENPIAIIDHTSNDTGGHSIRVSFPIGRN
ncbi:hypothetical protein ACWGKR_04465 [Bacillus thuringiensis]|uniref:hypothetical protein n=1 Tax=Bacillus thuringiensis TaxID=1428 RepID=UPI0035D5A55C|nr:hypothetical protein [Bacillus cereus]